MSIRRLYRLLPALLTSFLWLNPQTARAQAPVDSAGIARAVARFIAEDVLPEFDLVDEVIVDQGTTRFDSLVAREMASLPAFQRPVRDSARAVRVSTRGLTEMPYAPEHLRGLPAVIVRVSGCTPGASLGGEPGTWRWWANQMYYVFRRTGDGWEVAGGRTLDNADGGCAPPEPRRAP